MHIYRYIWIYIVHKNRPHITVLLALNLFLIANIFYNKVWLFIKQALIVILSMLEWPYRILTWIDFSSKQLYYYYQKVRISILKIMVLYLFITFILIGNNNPIYLIFKTLIPRTFSHNVISIGTYRIFVQTFK